ncbi:hypothetical protein R3W88_026839 [Solanum pinnatisectum]|uniref:DUF4283 domain-containing protein n=1 Tax=Solanum pinnatisectum TaxID=50273 RepID=A0AAV9LEC2_9SOLN|nr:hypothetical protein R3W88_026839 [Solanum pinnatisectum]
MQGSETGGDTQRKLDMNVEPTKKWVNFFNSNRMSIKGMSLSYVHPVMRSEEQVIKVRKEVVDKATSKWKQALILYVVGESPTITAIERYIALQVNTISKPKVYYHNDDYFLVRFASLDDRNEILYSCPHMLNNKTIIVKEALQTVPILVKYPNLPLNCWSMDSLRRISSGLRVPLYADECTTKVDRISFARVLVEMDVARELPKKLKVEDPNGRVFEQEVKYEWIPEYCPKCMQVGPKCTTKEGTRYKAAPKMVNKWVQKQDTTNVVVVPQVINGGKDKGKEQVSEEAETWKQVSPGIIVRGSSGTQTNALEMRMTNGFGALVRMEQGQQV